MTVAWITGGGSGIGRALAEALCRKGARVVITGRREEVLQQAVAEIEKSLGKADGLFYVTGDVTDPQHAPAVVQAVKNRWGDITLLINNAGSNSYQSIEMANPDDYQIAFQLNCVGAIRATHAVLPSMRAKGQGTIVNVSSVLGKWSSGSSATYSVSKYALTGFTDALRQQLIGTGLHVMGVFPGYVQTAMTSPFVEPGTVKSRIGVTPASMAAAILKGIHCRKAEVHYPWYVPWVLRLHRWAPLLADRLATRVKR